MIRTRSALAAAGILLASALPAAVHAAAPGQRAPTVTITASKAHILTSKRLVITGEYSRSIQVRVLLQEKKAGATWSTVSKATSGATGAYKIVYRPTEPGAMQYRTVAAGTDVRSVPVDVLVERWLFLTDVKPASNDCRGFCDKETTKISDTYFERSWVYSTFADGEPDQGASVTFNLGKTCTAFTTYTGITDYSSHPSTMTLEILTDGTSRYRELLHDRRGAIQQDLDVTGLDTLTLAWMHTGAAREDGAFATPQLRCAW